MNPVALAMSNKPVACIIFTASFQWDVMAYIPLLAGQHFHAAQMAQALMPQKDVSPCLSRYANTLNQ
jgi:hypothetical protein